MVLEALFGVRVVRKHPFNLFFMSFVLSSAGMWLAYFTFPESASILSIAFFTIGLMPLMHSLFVRIEREEALKAKGWCATFLERHFDIVEVFAWFFIGLIFSYVVWYVFLPVQIPAQCANNTFYSVECLMPEKGKIFAEQEKTWAALTGWAKNVTGNLTGYGPASCLGVEKNFWDCTLFIYSNNALVLSLSIVFSFMYGAGALFLLAWNASIIGIFIGKEILERHISAGIARAVSYLPHGVPEVMSYFIGSIAGAVISVAITHKKHCSHEFERIAKDTLFLLVISYIILFLAAMIEAYLIVGG